MAKGISINIGLNTLDTNHYSNDFDPLFSCIKDAQSMANIAKGFKVILLENNPKSSDVFDAVTYARSNLVSGDILLVTFSGHGSEIKDESGDEPSGYDQTWCLYDRQIIDDELARLWSTFPPGIRILFLSDSCHSGTVSNAPLDQIDSSDILTEENKRTINSISEEGGFDEFSLRNHGNRVRLLEEWLSKQIIDDSYGAVYKPIINELKKELASKGVKHFSELIQASVISISACQDKQLATESDDNGVFTAALKRVWNKELFQGNHIDFYNAIVKETRNAYPRQTPKYLKANASSFEQMRPFQI